ncbi:MAG: hypothetical protein QM813_18125 [Verrucomicrobiota bacterium]
MRKEPCSFGWDWGPVLATCGIWKSISLEAFDAGRIADVLIQQDLSNQKRARLEVEVSVDAVNPAGKAFKAIVAVSHQGRVVAKEKLSISENIGRGKLEIRNPKLWWPAGMGGQPLYDVHVELLDSNGETIDTTRRRIGFRELKVVKAAGDSPLHLEVNGIPFFSKGANWIPADSFVNRVTPEMSRRFVADADAVNMNTLRFWGGGLYEDDSLFDACDEMGICVWMDFKFACAAYPAFDAEFMQNVRLEARDNLRRLRHHPCIALWCGNNEISMDWWKGPTWATNRMSDADYDKLFVHLLAEEVKQHAPQATYVSGSPDCGDTHYWDVWHGGKPFEAYRTQGGFMSEFGFQSFPEPKTVRAFTNESDRASVITSVMNWHQRSGGLEANQRIVSTTLNYFRPPRGFEETLWLSQILQGFGIKLGAEYWRQTMPKSMGCVYWQYNDTWPGMSWSSVDYFGRWKALHYFARRFFAPILVSSRENLEAGTTDIFVSSDLLQSKRGTLKWRTTDLTGETLLQDQMAVAIPARKSEKVKTLDFQALIKKHQAGGFLTWLEIEVEGKTVSENLLLFTAPKELKLSDPQLSAAVEAVKDGFLVTLKSKRPALWAWLDLTNTDASYADNFFHVRPDASRQVLVLPAKRLSYEEFVRELQPRSLFDLCLPHGGPQSVKL